MVHAALQLSNKPIIVDGALANTSARDRAPASPSNGAKWSVNAPTIKELIDHPPIVKSRSTVMATALVPRGQIVCTREDQAGFIAAVITDDTAIAVKLSVRPVLR